MTKKKLIHNHQVKTCGNCGIELLEEDNFIIVSNTLGVGSNFFHSTPADCAAASDRPVIIPKNYKKHLYLLDNIL